MKKVLVIEDEKLVRNLIKDKLVQKGFEVELAKDGKIGMEKLEEELPDLILLDIVMPEMGGFEVLEAMEKENLLDIPVIIISNSGQPVEIDKAKEYEVEDWVVKTEFNPEEIARKVIEQIGRPKKKNNK